MLAIALGALVSVSLMRSNRVTVPTGAQKTVAVLPFDNVSGDADIDHLRLALADEVATALSSHRRSPFAPWRRRGNSSAAR